MVAGESFCSCAVCGAVCTGRYGGCEKVWANGPQPVTLRPTPKPERTTKVAPIPAGAAAKGRSGSPTNGGPTAPANGTSGLQRQQFEPRPVLPAPVESGSLTRELLAEVRALSLRVEQVHDLAVSMKPRDEFEQDEIRDQLRHLPKRIAQALAPVLRDQHQLIMKDVDKALKDFVEELAKMGPPEAGNDSPEVASADFG